MQIRLKMELKCEEFTEFPFICSLFSFNSTLFEIYLQKYYPFIYRNCVHHWGLVVEISIPFFCYLYMVYFYEND